jgi:hypothetical protein
LGSRIRSRIRIRIKIRIKIRSKGGQPEEAKVHRPVLALDFGA